jgi:hypothetical protein
LSLEEVCKRPPGACIDECKNPRANVCILPFGNRQIGDDRIEWRVKTGLLRKLYDQEHSLAIPALCNWRLSNR